MSGKHSKLSASSCERWWNCPGSVRACEKLPNPPSEYSAEGTVAHTIAEKWLRTSKRPEDLIGTVIVQDGYEIEVTEEMMDYLEQYVDYVQGLFKERGPTAKILFEVRIHLSEINEVMFGTGDAVIVVPYKSVDVADLKYGKGKRVSAWKNKQLMEYALGVWMQEDCNEFHLHICQPRVDEGFTKYDGEAAEMQQFAVELKEKAEAALRVDAPLHPGDWCKGTFCPNRVGCKALAALSKELVVKDFDDVPVTSTLTVEQIVKVLKYEDTVKDWMSKVRDYAKELMLQGVEVPGYKIIQSLGNAKWIDTEVIVAEFGDEYGERIYKPVEKELLSPAQFEKLVGKKKLGKDFREGYTIRPENGFKIVETEDKGEPVKTIKATEDF